MESLKQQSTFDRAGITIVVLIAIQFLAFAYLAHLNHDVAWIFYGAGELLSGGEFGRDVVDVNPPLAWWISMLPAFAAKLLEVPPGIAFRGFVLLLAIASVSMLWRINHRLSFWQVAAVAAVLIVTPGYDYGQRDHLLVILTLPYLASVLETRDNMSANSRSAIGVLAGLGVCLKPYFLVIPLTVEILRLTRTRRLASAFRRETMAMAGTGIVYVGAVLVFAPLYFSHVLPAALENYSAYSAPSGSVLIWLVQTSVPVLLALAMLALARVRFGTAAAFLAAGAGAAAAVLLQSKGWPYHALPVISYLLVAVILAIGSTRLTPLTIAALAVATWATAKNTINYAPQLYAPAGQEALVSRLSERIATLPAPRKVFSFVTSPRAIHPAVVSGNGSWTGSACCLYLLPAAVRNDSETVQTHAHRQLAQVAEMLLNKQPELILVDANPKKLGFASQPFDYIDFLKQQTRFVQVFERYREAAPIGHFRVFELRP